MTTTTLNRVENPVQRSNGASRLMPDEAPRQSLSEMLHAKYIALVQKEGDESLEESDAVYDLLAFQRPQTLRECIILLYVADSHLDMTLNGVAEDEDREVRRQTGEKVERILNSIRRMLMEIEGLKPEDLGFYPESDPAGAGEIEASASAAIN